MAIISMTVVSVITGCSQDTDTDSAFQTLDIERLESETTDIDDRAEYYDKYVDDRIDEMTEKEKEKFYVNLTLTYTKVIFTMEMIRSDFYREFIG